MADKELEDTCIHSDAAKIRMEDGRILHEVAAKMIGIKVEIKNSWAPSENILEPVEIVVFDASRLEELYLTVYELVGGKENYDNRFDGCKGRKMKPDKNFK